MLENGSLPLDGTDLPGKSADLACLTGEKKCADPVDALVAGFGFDRVVLVRGGQDESGYHFKVVSYRPATGEDSSSSAGLMSGFLESSHIRPFERGRGMLGVMQMAWSGTR